jgi:microcystin-dependent protein
MPDPFVGEVRIFAGSFAPTGWAFCDGQLLPISQNTALFSLLGTAYGGDGLSTFALPDLRGRAPIHAGQGPGLTPHSRGEKGGLEVHQLDVAQMPAHTHTMGATAANGTTATPAGGVPARDPAATPQYAASANVDLSGTAINPTGGGEPHNNMQPFLCVNYIIALQGVFPPHG